MHFLEIPFGPARAATLGGKRIEEEAPNPRRLASDPPGQSISTFRPSAPPGSTTTNIDNDNDEVEIVRNMDGDEDTLPIYHGQRTTGALNYYPATATQQQSGVDTSQYVHYPQQAPPPSQLAPPPQSSRSGGGRMYPLGTTNGGHNPLNRSISISSSTRGPQDGADGGYALDQATQTQSLSFYPAFHTHDSLPNQPTQQPDSGPAYYQGQPRRAHTQIDTR